jgi:AcrR family transcriptional regulator
MGARERRKHESEELKGKILAAAAEVLAEDGYKGLSVRKIAARIEYSPALIYHDYEDPVKTFLLAARSYVDLGLQNANLFRAAL